MRRLLDLTQNDLRLLLREKQTFLFLLLMPIGFTLIFGFAFGSFPNTTLQDTQKPLVVVIDREQSIISQTLFNTLQNSIESVQIQQAEFSDQDIEKHLHSGDIAAAIVVPEGFYESLGKEYPQPVVILYETSEHEDIFLNQQVKISINRVINSMDTANTISTQFPSLSFEEIFTAGYQAWENPPVDIKTTPLNTQEDNGNNGISAAQTAPGMMLQFSLAGLLTAGQMIVNERKTRVFQRLLTTSVKPIQILLGHYLAIFTIIFGQFILLIFFGQLVLKLNYFNTPLSTLAITFACALCIAAIGLVIGILAETDDQAIIFSLIPMFIFSGLGGAWMPLEFTGKTFQTIGHFSPVAWGMDGYKAILVNGANPETIIQSGLILTGYAIFFFVLAILLFKKKQA